MNPQTTLAASATSNGFVAALAAIIVLCIEKFGRTQVPAELPPLLIAVLAPIVHYAAIKLGADPKTFETKQNANKRELH